MALSVFLRDAPVVFPGYGVDERVILVVLSISTVVLLMLTHATVFLAGLAMGWWWCSMERLGGRMICFVTRSRVSRVM